MASYPPAQCCTVGVKHEGEAQGKIQKIGDYDAYVAHPKDGSTDNCVLILTDVIGHEFINAQLIADQFAANGYFTVMPDLFLGDPVPLNRPAGFDLGVWLKGPPGHGPDQIDPIVTSTIKELRSKHGVKRIGAVGYCFGAKYVVRFQGDVGKKNGAVADVGYVAHPSYVEEDELNSITGPLSISAAETDAIFPPEKRHRTEELLQALGQGDKKIPYQITLYSAVNHGFAVRGDLSDSRVKFAKEQAFFQAVQWFDQWLKQGK